MLNDVIRRHMTADPVTIGAGQPLSAAHKIMRERGIRHLPVLRDGKLVGVVSQHDLHFIETLRDVNPEQVLVEEAMSPEPYTVGPGATLGRVAAAMTARRVSSAVITEKGKVVGVFTTTDALRVLADLGKARTPKD